MWDLLTNDEKREVEAALKKVIAKTREPTEAEYNDDRGYSAYSESEKRSYREARAPVELSRRPFDGLWLRFVDAKDLEAWAKWLAVWGRAPWRGTPRPIGAAFRLVGEVAEPHGRYGFRLFSGADLTK